MRVREHNSTYMPVLYRKYRSKNFADVVGQQPIIRTLRNAAASKKPGHAYLFTGGRGVGKTSVARVFAKSINCLQSEEGDACLTCATCLAFDAGGFLDLVEIDAASNTGVDNIREIIEHVKFQNTQGLFKVFIIDEVHMLSKGAFNALLKTLEEPPAHVVFILATTEISKVPATIISRTQRFDFQRISEKDIQRHLAYVLGEEGLALPDGALAIIARAASGGMRDALSMLDKVLSLGGAIEISDVQSILGVTSWAHSSTLLTFMSNGQSQSLHSFFNTALEQGIDMFLFNRDFLQFLRQVLVYKISGDANLVDLPEDDGLLVKSAGQGVTVPDLLYVIRLFLRSYKEYSVTLEPELPMFLASLEACLRFTGKIQAAQEKPITSTAEPRAGEVTDAAKSQTNHSQYTQSATSPVNASSGAQSLSAVDYPSEEDIKAGQLNTNPENVTVNTVELEALQLLWPQICDKVRVINSPLATLVRSSTLHSLSDGKLKLGVKFLFHKEHLESAKNHTIISNAIMEVAGVRLVVRGELVKPELKAATDIGNVLGDAIRVFGGELVE